MLAFQNTRHPCSIRVTLLKDKRTWINCWAFLFAGHGKRSGREDLRLPGPGVGHGGQQQQQRQTATARFLSRLVPKSRASRRTAAAANVMRAWMKLVNLQEDILEEKAADITNNNNYMVDDIDDASLAWSDSTINKRSIPSRKNFLKWPPLSRLIYPRDCYLTDHRIYWSCRKHFNKSFWVLIGPSFQMRFNGPSETYIRIDHLRSLEWSNRLKIRAKFSSLYILYRAVGIVNTTRFLRSVLAM